MRIDLIHFYMKRWFLVLLAISAVLGLACSGTRGGEDPLYKSFSVIDFSRNYRTDPAAWYVINARKMAESPHALIYVDKNQPQITESAAAALALEFESVIYPTVTQYFASPFDADGNGKTVILVYDIKDPSSGGSIGGYFFSYDMYSRKSVEQLNKDYGTAFRSNESDMVYLDCNPQTSFDAQKKTLAHEFQHLVNYSYYLQNKTADNPTCTWIDEGLAEAANHLCYGAITARVSYYNLFNASGDINQSPLFYWNAANPLPNYSKSYLFFQYMKAQSSLGNDLFKEILRSTYGDYRAVTDAMALDGTLSSWSFDQILLRWYAVNNGVSNGTIYSYKGVLGASVPGAKYYTGTNPTLGSGAGISAPSSGYIYLAVNNDGSSEDFTGTGARDKLLAVFKNSGSSGTETGGTVLPSSGLEPEAGTTPAPVIYPSEKPMTDAVFTEEMKADMHGQE